MAPQAVARTAQARPGGHHQTRTAPGGNKPAGKINYHDHARLDLTKISGWKLFSLFLAVGIWLTVHTNSASELGRAGRRRSRQHADLRQSAGADRLRGGGRPSISASRPSTVSVTVSGSPDVMAVLQANQIHATVDLTDVEIRRISRADGCLDAARRLTLVSVDPRQRRA